MNPEAKPGTISLIIPNRDGKAYLSPCLDALAEMTRTPDEIIVVDDASQDGSIEFIKEKYPDVKVIPSSNTGEAQGFAGSVNTGIRSATMSDMAILNNDTKVEKEWLAELENSLKAHPGAASISSRMLQKDGKHINALCLILHADGTAGALGDGWEDGERFGSDCEIFGPSGGAALWRGSALERIGLFDEDYFAYYEDADLAFRARAEGFSSYYAARARVIHTEGRCPSLQRLDKVRLRLRNGIWFAFTNLPGEILRKRFFTVAWATGWRYFFKYGLRPWKVEGRSFWRAVLDIKLHPLQLWRKRKERQGRHVVAADKLKRWLGYNPFVENPAE